MIPVETIPRMGVDKEEWWRGWIQVWYTVRTSVNATIYLHPAQQ
jgi:hypothetical protein